MKIIISLSDSDTAHEQALKETGFWGRQGAGCLIVATDTHRVLFPHRSKDVESPLTWGTWGGAIDEGETPIRSVLRELSEEAGYHGRILSVEPRYVFKSGAFRYHNFLVLVPHEFTPKLNWETDGYLWADISNTPHPLHHGLAEWLARDPELVAHIGGL